MIISPVPRKICMLLFSFVFSLPTVVNAQVFGGGQNPSPIVSPAALGSSPSIYYFGQSQGVEIDVNVWGEVKQTGIHIVPYTTDLVALISRAGGPTINAKLSDVRVVRYAQYDTSVVEKVIKVDIEKFIETGEQRNFPVLLRGDTVIIPGGALSAIQNYSILLNVLTIVLNLVLLVTFINSQS
jgi:hypothetical protein